mmetsp:Transcript_56150/g.177925  ORF Transcript_56150/g.177925 Transcript_56150/m.177925 type:complete len:194 (-) Transcript_56150:77-658(-)
MTIVWIGAHLKAFPTDKTSCSQREAQATILQKIAREAIAAGKEVVLCGDLNDFSARDVDVVGSMPTSRVLEILQDVDGDGVLELINTASLLDKGDRYTSWYDRNNDDEYPGSSETSMIDHMLLSRGLMDKVTSVYVDHGHDPSEVSDHWPLVAVLDLDGSGGGEGGTSAAAGMGVAHTAAAALLAAAAVAAGL